jgi:hypothetical protein
MPWLLGELDRFCAMIPSIGLQEMENDQYANVMEGFT